MKKKKILVIDGQGGGFGNAIIRELKKEFEERFEIIAIGTNSIATLSMLEAGANKGATGENAIVCNSSDVDYIIGSISILIANSMLGELTDKMASAISMSKAKKILIPITQENITITCQKKEPLPHHIKDLVNIIKTLEVI
ncbi:MAG: DUF3842 family protein [Proteobacteria bacterium]|nr:DUF3842 family protein [Pseudomonadota bacterium]